MTVEFQEFCVASVTENYTNYSGIIKISKNEKLFAMVYVWIPCDYTPASLCNYTPAFFTQPYPCFFMHAY